MRNSFARQTIRAERVRTDTTCEWCGSQRIPHRNPACLPASWLYCFHVDDDSGSCHSGPIANGKLFCCRDCAESYIGHPFDECMR